ncbi:MAG TPA: hypothetical protein PK986_06750 [Spirochaetota bacterium]|nr:hypothetical protein [Spirochaetota bacterium]HQO40148.1 hypothetical protein [Spirochaetota bacterium]
MKKPYIYFKFLGIHSFISTLVDSNTEHRLYDENFDDLFARHEGIINPGDSMKTGILLKDGHSVFFAELGIRITKSYNSYFVFIFDHHPSAADLDIIIDDLEALVNANLESLDLSDLKESMTSALDSTKDGHLIN